MKKRTLNKLRSIFGAKSKGKRQQLLQQSAKSSRSCSPEVAPAASEKNFLNATTCISPSRPGPPPSPPVPTSPIVPVPPEPIGPLPLLPCAVCNRTFVPASLAKHVKICEKTAAKKRKTFDSSRQRREGTDLAQYLPKNFGLPENSPFLEKSPPNTAKTVTRQKSQTVRNPVAKPAVDLQKCPHCNRAFGVRAFERHVEWCGDKAKILTAAPAVPPAHVTDAKQRLNARIQYKAPPIRGRRSSQTRDKSSNSRSASVESSRGVSPPPAPRECGDYKRTKTRASESISSPDCAEDNSLHVPVIRNSRNSQNNSIGDAVKARQARLARDLSSSRTEDTYDPFLSAARQMKELMSSDTNIPNKLHLTAKDSNRTLPILRNSKEKSPSLFPDNTKAMKNAINKNYQKTPPLQRMKSFDSTNNYNNNVNTFGGRCSSFRLNNKNDKKSSQKLNSTFTKSSRESINTVDKNTFNRNSSLNRSFSTYTTNHSTPKPKDKIPKINLSLHHSFQRTIAKQPVKLEKINVNKEKPDFVNLDSILIDDNSSTNDSNYIDPRLINENDNLPINVNTILNNPDIIGSIESLINTENLPAKFDSFNSINHMKNLIEISDIKKENKAEPPSIDDLSIQYDKIMTSLEHSINSKASVKDDESLCEDFDLEEFMTSFDEELNKQKNGSNKRTYSSTTRIVKVSEQVDSNKNSELNIISPSPKINHNSNGIIPFNKSISLDFSTNNIPSDTLYPSSYKRSSSFLDPRQKKNMLSRDENQVKSRHRSQKSDQLEQDIMKSLKEFDNFYETGKTDNWQSKKDVEMMNSHSGNGFEKRDSQMLSSRKNKKLTEDMSNGKSTPKGKPSSDSAYSSLNRISPPKLTICNSKVPPLNTATEQAANSSDSGSSNRDHELRSGSSEEFLAMERSTESHNSPNSPLEAVNMFAKDIETYKVDEKRNSSRASSRQSGWRSRRELSSSGSESSLCVARQENSGRRLSRFCHECGGKFPFETAKFCIECGVKRLVF